MSPLVPGSLVLLLCALPGAAAEPPLLEPWALRVDYGQARFSGDRARLGLAGLSLLAGGGSGFYLGPSLQTAVRGDRGGFFAGGLEGGLRATFTPRWTVDAGLFLGGGGGWGSPVGGGFMLRPRLGLTWDAGAFRLGMGLAHLRFPSGEMRSTQAYFTWERSFSSLRLTALPERGDPWWPPGQALQVQRQFLEVHGTRYASPGGFYPYTYGDFSATRGLLGITWGRFLGDPWFLQLQASAAAKGGTAGYMEVLAGLGARVFLDPGQRWALRASLGAGSGGGGGIGTGGGFLLKGEAGLQFQLTPGVHVFMQAGRVGAPVTPFRAATLSVGAGFTLGWLAPGQGEAQAEPVAEPKALRWRLSSGIQRYASVARKREEPASPLEQFVLKGELLLSDGFYLTGQSGWATGGHAGAWATGLLGAGAQTPAWHGHRLRLELAAGGGGGGGVESRGGILIQGLAGWNWDCSRSWSVHLLGGSVRGPRGGLSSPVLELGLGWRGIHPVLF